LLKEYSACKIVLAISMKFPIETGTPSTQKLVHTLAQATDSDKRAIAFGLIAVTASVGGAVIFEALIV
jgi:hypothetical protein